MIGRPRPFRLIVLLHRHGCDEVPPCLRVMGDREPYETSFPLVAGSPRPALPCFPAGTLELELGLELMEEKAFAATVRVAGCAPSHSPSPYLRSTRAVRCAVFQSFLAFHA
jgi:hypothetical protein